MKNLISALLVLCASPSYALIVYDSINTSAPGGFDLWDNVVSVNGSSGTYIGQGWVVSANHVGTPGSVNVQGQSYSVAAGTTLQIGTADLRIFRLDGWESLTLPDVNVTTGWAFDPATSAVVESGSLMTAVGYGVGKGATTAGGWLWNSTTQKQWGLMPVAVTGVEVLSNHSFDRSYGSNAAAGTLHDSGGGVFYQTESGWHLGGVITHVSDSGKSLYDRNSVAAGDQPGYTLSQRTAGKNGAEIYRLTGVWGLAESATAASDGGVWIGDPAAAGRILLSGTASFSGNIGMVDASGTPVLSSAEIGTLVLRDNAAVTLNGSSRIQAMAAGTNASLLLKNGTFSVMSSMPSPISYHLENSVFGSFGYGSQITTLILDNSSFAASADSIGTLIVKAGGSVTNQAPFYLSPLGGGEGSWSYNSVAVSGSIVIEAGAELSTANFRPGNAATLLVDGTLKIEGPGQITLNGDNLTLTENASVAFDLGPSESYFGGGLFATATISGTDSLVMRGELHILNPEYAGLGQSYTLFRSTTQDYFDLQFSNIAGGVLHTVGGTFEIASTWNGTYQEITASNFNTVPEPGVIGMVAVAATVIVIRRRRFNTVSQNLRKVEYPNI